MSNHLDAVSEIETDNGLTFPVDIFHEDLFYGSVTSRLVLPDEVGYLRAEFRLKTNEYYLAMIQVDEDYRNQGIGRELVKLALDDARTTDANKITGTATNSHSEAIFLRVFGQDSLSKTSVLQKSAFLNFNLR